MLRFALPKVPEGTAWKSAARTTCRPSAALAAAHLVGHSVMFCPIVLAALKTVNGRPER
jgi:hypothetical protein